MEFEELEHQVRKQVEDRLGRRLSDDEWETFKRIQAESVADVYRGEPEPPKRGVAPTIGLVLLSSLIWAALLVLWALGPIMIASAVGFEPGQGEGATDWGGLIFVAWFVFIVPIYWIYRALFSSGPLTRAEYKVMGIAVGFALASPAAGGTALLVVGNSGWQLALGVVVAVVGLVVSIYVGLAIATLEDIMKTLKGFRRTY